MREKSMEKKRTQKPTKKQEALAHIERIRMYGAPYYRKQEVLKMFREFIELYWR